MTEIYVTKTRESIVYKLAGDLLGGGRERERERSMSYGHILPFFFVNPVKVTLFYLN